MQLNLEPYGRRGGPQKQWRHSRGNRNLPDPATTCALVSVGKLVTELRRRTQRKYRSEHVRLREVHSDIYSSDWTLEGGMVPSDGGC